ncbi:MAG: hypothetical protein A3H70_03840 [Candidatus Komeilibacteria bacterium RIFCSPLOWO2_02_FULL_48_11]|uniref:Exostosin GT47 domain-containing protein n=1 Tax=Candidatus Komeilibacteria bacterium RIFCSPLOWO2_02_FULL_48_11 TaxID=1798553 RepID=A0A1G2BNX3_9BACT|nr:MAG: hypothetical protein A3H70_03840 [Candidatus Komeilibacteria bacterium RIFCSPLOWO2_02_FULL_48_11]
MVKVYIGQPLTISHLPVLYPNLGVQKKERSLFMNNVFAHYTEPIFEIVADPNDADYFLLPHDYFLLFVRENEYMQRFAALAEKYGKKVIVFAHGDPEIDIPINNSIVFRIARYGRNKKPNEIIMPVYGEDLLQDRPLSIRRKGAKPVVGFCGWARLGSAREKLAYYVKDAIWSVKNFLPGNQHLGPERQGMWFRRQAIKILEKSSLVESNFKIRESFSGHRTTIKLDPAQARAEYIDNMLNSDFILTVKGGGNCSMRFYEALSLGRIPLFIKTDNVLPFEDIINYREFVVFVNYDEVDLIDTKLSDFYNALSDDDFIQKQKRARETYEKYLRLDSFFRLIPDILNKKASQRER